MKGPLCLLLCCAAVVCSSRPAAQSRMYCNPLNLDYAYAPIPNFTEQGRHRASADPTITLFRGDYYLFSTNQRGYWWSADLLSWKFVPRSFLLPRNKVYDDLCAPATLVMGDTLLVIGSSDTLNFPLWMSTNPRADDWKVRVDSFGVAAWDPALFADDNGRVYLYYGSSNLYPIYGQELDRKTFSPIGERHELIRLHPDLDGWERFGEHNDNVFLNPFIEGAWMNKQNGVYYLQYGAPGTEFSGYADGVYTASSPLGPFTMQLHNPFSYKPGGFARGAGHGASFKDIHGNWWHVATISISVKNNFERRIGLFPAAIDRDGVLYAETAYGDYPHGIPGKRVEHPGDLFSHWMLLNYCKPVTVSSTLGGHEPNFAVDEDIRTYWSAATADSGEWLQSDLGGSCTIRAIQVNYADQNARFLGKQQGIFHRYIIRASGDGKRWTVIVDKRNNTTDVPHDFTELSRPVTARFVRIENVHVPTGEFALSGFRIFGTGNGNRPQPVREFVALRGESERRAAWLKWKSSDDAFGYTIRFGVAPDKLYGSIMVYGDNEYYFPGMNKSLSYYFCIEAFNENGISERSSTVKAE